MRSVLLALAVAAPALAFAPSLAFANAPEPRKAIEFDRFMGRWYEILRTPNGAQKNCHAAYQTWSQVGPGKFSIAQVCHKDSRTGPEKTVNTPARTVDSNSAKFEASFFGGIFKRQYWVLDHADNYDWMIASTSDGNFVSLLARKPGLPRSEMATLTSRIGAMGLDTGKLVQVGE